MAGSGLMGFFIFWGVWLLIPLLVDMVETLWSAWLVFRNRRLAEPVPMPYVGRMPTVTVVIPAYNEQVDIDRCLTSLKAQTYPQNLTDYIVVNDGSTDRTGEVVASHIDGTAHPGHIRLHNLVISGEEYGGDLRLVQGRKIGKPRAVNLGLAHAQGELIMAIDSDVVLEPDAVEQTLYPLLVATIQGTKEVRPGNILLSTSLGLDLLPTNIEMSQLELDLVSAMSREQVLKRALRPLSSRYDYILLDCGPNLGLITINALTAADAVLIPLQADYLAMKGVAILLRVIDRVKANLNPRLRIMGILLTMADTRTLHTREVIEATRRAFEGRLRVFDTIVKASVKVKDSSVSGRSVLDYAPDSQAAEAYRGLAQEVMHYG